MFFFHKKYQGPSGQVLNACDDIVFRFQSIAEHYWNCMFKEPIIRHSYHFSMYQAIIGIVEKLMMMAHRV